MRDGWQRVKLGKFLTQVDRPVEVANLDSVPFAGVRWYADGVYPRPVEDARKVKTKTLNRLTAGDVTYNRMWATKASFGIAGDDVDGCLVTNDFPIFQADLEQVLVQYVGLIFIDAGFQRAAARAATGTTERRRLKERDFLSIEVDLAPLAEQRRVIEVVSSIDLALEATAESLAALNLVKKGLAESLIASACASGVEVRLGDVMTIVRGGSPRPIQDYMTSSEEGLNWIKIGDVDPDGRYVRSTAGKIRPEGLSKTRLVRAGDFILSNSMSFGRPYILKIDGCIHDGWLALSQFDQSFEPDFLYYLLRSDKIQAEFDRLAAGSSVRNLKKESVAGIKVRIPPLDEQEKIVEILRSADDTVDCCLEKLATLRGVRAELIAALLTGDHEIPESYEEPVGARTGRSREVTDSGVLDEADMGV